MIRHGMTLLESRRTLIYKIIILSYTHGLHKPETKTPHSVQTLLSLYMFLSLIFPACCMKPSSLLFFFFLPALIAIVLCLCWYPVPMTCAVRDYPTPISFVISVVIFTINRWEGINKKSKQQVKNKECHLSLYF